MKRIFKSLWILGISAMALSSCAKDEPETVTININAGSVTSKTHLDATTGGNGEITQVKWDGPNEKLRVLEINGQSFVAKEAKCNNVSEDGVTAEFSASFRKKSGMVSYCAIYPSSSYRNFQNQDNTHLNKARVTLPSVQASKPKTFDPKADLLVSKIIGKESQATAAADGLDLYFKRPVALVQMTLKGMPDLDSGENFTSITFESEGKILSGIMEYDFESYKAVYTGTNSVTCYNTYYPRSGNEFPVFFTTFPVDLDNFTISFSTTKGKLFEVAPVTGISLQLSENTLNKFTVNLTDKTVKKSIFHQIKSVDELKDGDRIIIGAQKTTTDKEFVSMSKRWKTSHQFMESDKINIKGGEIISSLGDSRILTLSVSSEGNKNYYSFETSEGNPDNTVRSEGGYLSVVSTNDDSNYLITSETKDKFSQWSIEKSENYTTDNIFNVINKHRSAINKGCRFLGCYDFKGQSWGFRVTQEEKVENNSDSSKSIERAGFLIFRQVEVQ